MELLVLLALASLALLAVGGLQYAAIGYFDAQERNARMQQALFELQTVAVQLSKVPSQFESSDATGFSFHTPETTLDAGWRKLGDVRLDRPTRVLAVQLLKNLTRIDLSAFSAATLEYLIDEGEAPHWTSATDHQMPAAARLLLWDGSVAWRPLIWSTSPLRSETR